MLDTRPLHPSMDSRLDLLPAHDPPPLHEGTSTPSKSRRARQRRQGKRAIPPRLITTAELSVIRGEMEDLDDKLRLTTRTPTLPLSFFASFSRLRILDLRNVGLERLPSQIIELQNLQELDLRNNNLTYLPSQVAQIPNLCRLQMQDIRNRKNILLEQTDCVQTEGGPIEEVLVCRCERRPNGERIPPLPTLAQICIRTIIKTISSTPPEDTEELSWQDLEPFYSTGKLAETSVDILPFPSHLLPPYMPIDLCSTCLEPAFPAHAEFELSRVVALSRVRLRYVFCSHECASKCLNEMEKERMEIDGKKRARQKRFHIKDHNDVDI